ncbi:MAG: NADH-quinone oxidoreductase subunit M [Acidimicrobiia bacterium]|nr:NADH-quinone oxidoreductase subunit M [Acidimicrobiia bacterium]
MEASFPILTILVLLPVASGIVLLLLPKDRTELVLPVAILLSLLPLGATGWILYEFQTGFGGFQFVERSVWYEAWGVGWHLGIDGISLFLVALTTFLFPLSLLASTAITDRVREYAASMLFLEAGILGVFVALDLLVFFVFWEAMLVPMYFIIGIWGGTRRVYAAVKFFLYTALGSALMFAGILWLAVSASDQLGGPTFDFTELLGVEIARTTQFWLFAGFALSFGIKVPLFPFHTWLPDAHVEAPTAGSVILAGVLLKLGAYGLVRFNLTLFPEATVELVPVLAVLSVIGIIYGAVVAIVQSDIKRLVAYSSVSHLGFVVLGIFALTTQGLQGGVIQMVNHGLTTGVLFILVGMIYERRHTREIGDFGGLARVMPLFAGAFLFTAFASIGLPGLNGFVGEFLVLMGSYLTLPVYAIIASFGVILAAVYLLWAYQRMFTGPITVKENEGLADVGFREAAILLPMVALIVFLGVYPKPALERIEPSVQGIIDRIELTTDYEAPEFGVEADLAGEGDE